MFVKSNEEQKQLQINPTSDKKQKKNNGLVKEFFAKLSRGLMLPISMLPIAGIMIGVGSIFTTYFDSGTAGYIVGSFFSTPGKMIFNCLPLLFAVSIAITFTKDAGAAGLCCVFGWILFNAFQTALIQYNYIDPSAGTAIDNVSSVNFLFYHYDFMESGAFSSNSSGYQIFNAIFTTNIGMKSLSTSVFGGIVVGTTIAFLFNKFRNVQLPILIGFFSGVRFVPIVAFFGVMILSLIFAIIWPVIGMGLYWMGVYMAQAPGGLNSFFIAFLNRALLPFGLHFVVTTLVNYTTVGGTFYLDSTAIVDFGGQFYSLSKTYDTWTQVFGVTTGETQIVGENLIQWFLMGEVGKTVNLYAIDQTTGTVLSDIPVYTNVKLTYDMIWRGTAFSNNGLYTFIPGQYTSGAGSIIMICLPVAAISMMLCAPKGNDRKLASSILVSAAFVSFFTGITEPIEFTFLFLAPWLYWGFHAVMYGFAAMLNTMFILYTGVGPHTPGACFLDYVFYSIVPSINGGGVNLWVPIVIGLGMAPIYFMVFRWAILKFNLATPGRGGNTKLISKADYQKSKANSSNKKAMNYSKAYNVIEAYGGISNIKDIGACFTKLRVQINDKEKVNKEKLIELGARGVIFPSPQSAFAIFGTEADVLKNYMNELIKSPQLYEETKVSTNLININHANKK